MNFPNIIWTFLKIPNFSCLQIVRESLQLRGRCQGGFFNSDPCRVKTMWTVLAPYEVVSSKLKEKYHRALQVSFINIRLQQLRPHYPIDQNLVYLDDSPCYIVRNDSLGINGMLGRSCRRDMSDDRCELFTAICDSIGLNPTIVEYYKQVKWRCKFTCAAKLNVRHALRSTMKQGVPCKRMLYCVSSIKRFSWLTPCIVQVVPFYSVWPFKPIVLF